MLEEIKHWLVYEGGICPESDNHFGGNPFANAKLGLKIQQRPGELAQLIEFLLDKRNQGEKIDYYAEIGACSGGTTRSINHFLNFKELLIIDDGGVANNDCYVNERGDWARSHNLECIPRIEIIGSSLDQRVISHAHNISKIHLYDVLFIDGDHSYHGVKSDTLNYLSIVRPGGYVIFHDTCHISDIMQWINEVPSVTNMEMVKHIGLLDEHTDAFPNGIGLTVFKKN